MPSRIRYILSVLDKDGKLKYQFAYRDKKEYEYAKQYWKGKGYTVETEIFKFGEY